MTALREYQGMSLHLKPLLPPVADLENGRRVRANLHSLQALDNGPRDADVRPGRLNVEGDRVVLTDAGYLVRTGSTMEEVRLTPGGHVTACQVFAPPGRPVQASIQVGEQVLWADLGRAQAEARLTRMAEMLRS